MPIPVGPPVTTPTSFPGDYSGTINGLPFGTGTSLRTVAMTGWRDMVAAPLGGAGQLLPRSQANGSYPVPYFMPARVVTIQVAVETVPGAQLEAVLAELEAATQPSPVEVPLTIQVGGVSATAYGTVSSRLIPTGLEALAGYSLAQIEVTCSDPRKFAEAIALDPIMLPVTVGGMTWPVTWPISWPGTVVTGSGAVVNGGNTAGPITLRINGPVTAPQIVHVESGSTLAFSSSLTIAAGDWLDINCEARTALYNGQASRNTMLTSRGWPVFQPGANTLHFNAGSYSSAASLQVVATPSYI